MRKSIFVLIVLGLMGSLLVMGCQPKQSEIKKEVSPSVVEQEIMEIGEETSVDEGLGELDDLDTLTEETEDDLTFEELDNLELE